MERNREARRVSMAAANGLASRRRHRSGSGLRDSPEDDGPMELQETARLRDRGTVKKDRDRDRDRDSRDRERDHRERERDRDRDRMSSRGKRRRGDRLMNREDGGGDDSSEESVNDDEDDEDDDGGLGSSMRMLPPNPSSLSSSSLSNHHHRKSFPPPAKVIRTSPAATSTAPWKAPDEMIGVSVPRKARSASTKRSHEWASSCGVGPEQINRQASTSPTRSSGQNAAAMLASASASPAPVSPSSSNVSVKKKMKPNGPKQRPPKSSSKFTSSVQDEIEIEIAEVLYGLMRQGPAPKVEIIANDSMRFDSREVSNSKTSADAKSRVSSPISNSQSTHPHSSAIPLTNSSSSMSAIAAPKRKRPRPVKYEDENPSIYPARSSPISPTIKVDNDQTAKTEASSPNLEKNLGSVAENGVLPNTIVPASVEPLPQPEPVKSENNPLSDLKPSTQESESRDLAGNKEEPRSPKKESPVGDDRECVTVKKSNSIVFEIETQREKYQIDLMAPPPLRSSPERDNETDYVAVDPKPVATDVAMEIKPAVKEDDKELKIGRDVNLDQEDKKAKIVADVAESQKPVVIPSRERTLDLQLDLEKSDRDSGTLNGSANKVHQNAQKPHQPNNEKTAQSNAHPLPMSMPSWPGGLPHMGYMAPLQGVVSMDGNVVPPPAIQPSHLLFNQPRPKRCATHCYIARNIHCHQQFTRINPFWSAAAGSALQYGAKACNVNLVPSTDLHPGRSGNSVQDKGQNLAIFPGHAGKEKSSQNTNIVDAGQRKQILLQQQLPPGAPGAPNNMLHGPTFIFPLNQQQAVAAAAAASVRPGTVKSPVVPSNASSSSAPNSAASTSGTSTAVAGATAMSFNYPNMPGSETQYLAILQNSAYPIPIPAHVGASPPYRGTPPQAMPFFNGSFYSSQILHPQQLQQQQSSSQHTQQGQQGHQNPSISTSSSSSQKHLQNQQHRSHNSGVNGGSGTLQGFPTSKNQPSQSMQLQQRQQMQNQNAAHQSEESPSTADSRVSHSNMSIYGQNFAMPIHPPNYAMMSQATVGGATTAGSNHGEKKQQQAQQSSKIGVEPSQAFAMSFASINGATAPPGSIDISSFAQNHAILQSLPDAARHGYHFMTAAAVAQAAQQKKNHRVSEEGKSGGNDNSNLEEERKAMSVGKVQTSAGQSTGFSWTDLTDSSISAGNTVIDSSARTLNIGNAPARASGSIMSATISGVNASSMQQQMQRNHQQQQQQMIQLQKQQQFAAAAAASARSKTPVTSNGNVYSDHISSSSPMVAKFSNTLSGFSPSLVQGSSSPGQSPQWKNAIRTTSSQVPSPSSLASTSSSLKNLPQQQGRMPNQHSHTQISFAANPKQSGTGQGQQVPNGSQSPSPPMVVGSPSTSSMSKSAGGSPRTTSTSTSNKVGQSSATLSSQQAKNSPSVSAQKSSPVGGRTIPSILGHPHNTTSSSNSAVKAQLQQHHQQQHHQQQQQLAKHSMQQSQCYGGYMQAQVQHAANSAHASAAPSGFYLQRHRSEQQQQQHQQGPIMTSSGMMLCPSVSLGTNDPAKAAAAAASNMKGGNITSQGLIHAQFSAAQQSSGKPHIVPAGFPYVTMPAAVQVKPAEQKQPAAE